ncbi:hypothetical protein F5Y15DRAFT_427217 [Xylariaceae sp. FL0016]|nr:hypothetical protein F5Y15DRAFT_427217 [Xylariaceae sp. FL0016]
MPRGRLVLHDWIPYPPAEPRRAFEITRSDNNSIANLARELPSRQQAEHQDQYLTEPSSDEFLMATSLSDSSHTREAQNLTATMLEATLPPRPLPPRPSKPSTLAPSPAIYSTMFPSSSSSSMLSFSAPLSSSPWPPSSLGPRPPGMGPLITNAPRIATKDQSPIRNSSHPAKEKRIAFPTHMPQRGRSNRHVLRPARAPSPFPRAKMAIGSDAEHDADDEDEDDDIGDHEDTPKDTSSSPDRSIPSASRPQPRTPSPHRRHRPALIPMDTPSTAAFIDSNSVSPSQPQRGEDYAPFPELQRVDANGQGQNQSHQFQPPEKKSRSQKLKKLLKPSTPPHPVFPVEESLVAQANWHKQLSARIIRAKWEERNSPLKHLHRRLEIWRWRRNSAQSAM